MGIFVRKFGLLAAFVALPVSALDRINYRAAPARETDHAELVDKSSNGVSPVPTSRPELAEMELFKRDYTLPSDFCGWYADYKCMFSRLLVLLSGSDHLLTTFTAASYTCGMVKASCINVGNYRGCCNGPSLSCASTFYSACIPSKALTSSQSCGKGTICW